MDLYTLRSLQVSLIIQDDSLDRSITLTGFCGSLTTFSGWQYDVFMSWTNAGSFRRSGLRDVRRRFHQRHPL
jgi:fluoride ion exporter CrcB/FEX